MCAIKEIKQQINGPFPEAAVSFVECAECFLNFALIANLGARIGGQEPVIPEVIYQADEVLPDSCQGRTMDRVEVGKDGKRVRVIADRTYDPEKRKEVVDELNSFLKRS